MAQLKVDGNTFLVFGNISGADAYLSADLTATQWRCKDVEDKRRLLIMATRLLETLDLCHPENGENLSPVLDDTETPIGLINGAYALASEIATNPDTFQSANTGSNIKIAAGGSASVEFFRPTDGTVIPIAALRLIRPYIKGVAGGSGLYGVVNGNDCESEFIEGPPGFSEGIA